MGRDGAANGGSIGFGVRGGSDVAVVRQQRANAGAITTGMSVGRGQRGRRVLSAPWRISTPLKFEMSKNGRLSVSIKRHRQEPLPAP